MEENILKTLLYYDIFSHPLRNEEIFTFLPENSVAKEDVFDFLRSSSEKSENSFAEKGEVFPQNVEGCAAGYAHNKTLPVRSRSYDNGYSFEEQF